jgi:outer membrane protein assembly factor BamA
MESGFVLALDRWRSGHSFAAGYSLELRRPHTLPSLRPDDARPALPDSGPTGSLVLSWSHSNVRAFRDSVSIERGRRLFARLRASHPGLLSAARLIEISGDYRQYLPVPALPSHVWFVSVRGGLARGDIDKRRTWLLGGLPRGSLFLDAWTGARYGAGYLRGYPDAVDAGDGYLLATCEWRFPVLEVQQGLFTAPVFVDRVRGVAFADAGLVFDDVPRGTAVKRGIGAELLMDTVVFYLLPLDFRLGIARGLDRGGLDAQVYFVLGVDS